MPKDELASAILWVHRDENLQIAFLEWFRGHFKGHTPKSPHTGTDDSESHSKG